MSEWRPISDAPKDGTVVLVCDDKDYPRHLGAATYADGCWWWESEGHEAFPTHYMPLPKEPK
jgi:hypothetical protein